MKCQICHKPSKENTEGNPKYCQGHTQAEARKALNENRKTKPNPRNPWDSLFQAVKDAQAKGEHIPTEVLDEYADFLKPQSGVVRKYRDDQPRATDGKWTTGGQAGMDAIGGTDTAKMPTDSPEFRNWFKDSKVVNADGSPMAVYHGTVAKFKAFTTDKNGAVSGWFTNEKKTAQDYARPTSIKPGKGRIVEAYLRIEKPVSFADFGLKFRGNIDAMKQAGYDGVIHRRANDTVYIVFHPTQIKAVRNNARKPPHRLLLRLPPLLRLKP